MIVDIITIIGLTIIIGRSKIFRPFRNYISERSKFVSDMLSCLMCTGVWVGGIYYFIPEVVEVNTTYINIKLIFNIFVKEIISYASIGGLCSEIVYLIIKKLKNE